MEKSQKIAIIGSANRHGEFGSIGNEFLSKMENAFIEKIRDFGDLKDAILVSGGAAWSDHIAVRLFLRDACRGLELHLPSEWKQGKFQEPAKTANYYHYAFSKAIGQNSLHEIQQAINKGAVVHCHNGYHERNSFVAKEANVLVAFTWGPISGGTLDTWKKTNPTTCTRIHIPLESLHKKMMLFKSFGL